MAFHFDPRGDLPLPSAIQSSYNRTRSSLLPHESKLMTKRLSSLSLSSKPRMKTCHDWIFSSATNAHIALDRTAFKEYMPFDSYVLTLGGHQRVLVRGIGTVELKIRRRPENKESHTIILTDVLHIPSWLCNIFSDVYFNSGHEYEHLWTDHGIQLKKRENNELRCWGFTESFCSLDRLVLAKRHKDSRSPMLEDKDRGIFSINVRWPQSQHDHWHTFLAHCQNPYLFRTGPCTRPTPAKAPVKDNSRAREPGSITGTVSRRATLSDINANIVKHAPAKRVSSLKATISSRELSQW